MKACLMKVNYDPKYVTPGIKRSDTLQTRLSLTKQIYAARLGGVGGGVGVKDGTPPRDGKHRAHRSAPDFVFRTMGTSASTEQDVSDSSLSKENLTNKNRLTDVETCPEPIKSKSKPDKSRAAKSNTSIKLVPLRDSNAPSRSYSSDYTAWSQSNHGDNNKQGMDKHRTYTQTSFSIFNNKTRTLSRIQDRNQKDMMVLQRSKTVPPPDRIKFRSVAMIQMERKARTDAERAVREKKIFCIHGPYPSLRHALRRRGWVEQFTNCPTPSELELLRKSNSSVEDIVSDNGDQKDKKLRPWEEENGYFAMMSYLVRNSTPTFIFTVKSADVDSRVTKSNQLVNHFGKARHFTTKSGLCLNLRHAVWYEKTDPYTFYPRCYKIDDQEERKAFIDDYRWTCCLSLLRSFADRYRNSTNIPKIGDEPGQPGIRHPRLPLVPPKALEMASQQINKFLRCQQHNDIDELYETDVMADCEWDQFVTWYYLFIHECCDIAPITVVIVQEVQELLNQVKGHWPQYELDGVKNIWIIKPGAMSRGRGIQCADRLDNILKTADSSDSALVVQKYIERPFLVYETKFDIRQWFLVTDWNPLTVWIYKDNYLRFCSREYTLQDFSPAVHLSNNSITKHLRNGPRSSELPEDNTWTSEEFIQHLDEQGQGEVWNKKVIPGIKNAIVCALLCTQEYIEGRKSAFELYGADFMLTRDYSPWLLEINSSPSMSQSTRATAELVDRVLEDTIKVVLDRRMDKNVDTGRFELAYKQQLIHDPPPMDHNLIVHGRRVRNKSLEKNVSEKNNHKRDKSPTKSPMGRR